MYYIEPHDRKFLNLTVDSRLEIAFAGRPRGLRFQIIRSTSTNIQRGSQWYLKWKPALFNDIFPMLCDFDVLQIERTDFLRLTGCARHVSDMRVSYMNA